MAIDFIPFAKARRRRAAQRLLQLGASALAAALLTAGALIAAALH